MATVKIIVRENEVESTNVEASTIDTHIQAGDRFAAEAECLAAFRADDRIGTGEPASHVGHTFGDGWRVVAAGWDQDEQADVYECEYVSTPAAPVIRWTVGLHLAHTNGGPIPTYTVVPLDQADDLYQRTQCQLGDVHDTADEAEAEGRAWCDTARQDSIIAGTTTGTLGYDRAVNLANAESVQVALPGGRVVTCNRVDGMWRAEGVAKPYRHFKDLAAALRR